MVDIDTLTSYYDFLEPRCLDIAKQVVNWHKKHGDPGLESRYLVETSYRILASTIYKRDYHEEINSKPIQSALVYLDLLEDNLEQFLSGNITGSEIVKIGGRQLWDDFNTTNVLMDVFSQAVTDRISDKLAGKDVLELGGGVGGTTLKLNQSLQQVNSFYFTDIKPYFLESIAKKLPELDINTQLLNLKQPPNEFPNFDIVFATNVLHVVSDIGASLNWILDHLKPGGLLVLGEGSPYSRESPWPLELMFSLFRGWWDILRFQDRPYPGWLLPEQWLRHFSKVGIYELNLQIFMDEQRFFGGIYQIAKS